MASKMHKDLIAARQAVNVSAMLREWVQRNYVPLSPIPQWWQDILQDEAMAINMAQCREVLPDEELTEAYEVSFPIDLNRIKSSYPPPSHDSGRYSVLTSELPEVFPSDILRNLITSHR